MVASAGIVAAVPLTRGSEQTITDPYYSSGWQVLEERTGGTPDGASASCQYVWGLQYVDEMVCRDRDTNADGTLDERLYALQDANFNVTAICDTSGTVVERYLYDPYGAVRYTDEDQNKGGPKRGRTKTGTYLVLMSHYP